MPSCPLPLIALPEIHNGWKALDATSVKSTLIPWAPLRVKAPPVIDTGERVLTPSAALLLIRLLTKVRFCARRVPVGVPIAIPVAAYRTTDSVSVLALPASRTRPPQSPAVASEQTPDAFGTKTEPQLGRSCVCSFRLVRTAPVEVSLPPWTIIVPASSGA